MSVVKSPPSWERALEAQIDSDVYHAADKAAILAAQSGATPAEESSKQGGGGGGSGFNLVAWGLQHGLVRTGLQVSLLTYVGYNMFRGGTVCAVESGPGARKDGASYMYTSPEGLKMTVVSSTGFPHKLVLAHHISALSLLPLVLAQKELAWHMRLRRIAEEKKQAPPPMTLPVNPRTARSIHGALGFLTQMSVVTMAYSGFALRKYSAFHGMKTAMIFFVAPWVVLEAAIMASLASKSFLGHAVVGNIMFKASFAVPLARFLGVLLQKGAKGIIAIEDRMNRSLCPYSRKGAGEQSATTATQTPQTSNSSSSSIGGESQSVFCFGRGSPLSFEEKGYYGGIVLSAVIIGAWTLYDTVRLVRAYTTNMPTKPQKNAEEEEKKA